ncbi:DUF192 domain-containing protein [Candidatus Peregrinibacteria bacterium]|nr:DUF192 domain-containing protein [Candidatus Peregrinibacteria bacterium]
MKNRLGVLGLILMSGLMLTGCFDFTQKDVRSASLDAKVDLQNANVQPIMLNQDLPVKKLVITSGKDRHEFEVEVASNEAQRKVGLMNRKALDENKGMLFIFQSQGYMNFWMKNTLIPLDMIFIDQDGIIQHIAKNARPCTEKDDRKCDLYNSAKPVKFVLEVNGGVADQKGIRIGDKVTWL